MYVVFKFQRNWSEFRLIFTQIIKPQIVSNYRGFGKQNIFKLLPNRRTHTHTQCIYVYVPRRFYNSSALRSLQGIIPFSMGIDGSRSGSSHDQHLRAGNSTPESQICSQPSAKSKPTSEGIITVTARFSSEFPTYCKDIVSSRTEQTCSFYFISFCQKKKLHLTTWKYNNIYENWDKFSFLASDTINIGHIIYCQNKNAQRQSNCEIAKCTSKNFLFVFNNENNNKKKRIIRQRYLKNSNEN